MNALWPPAEQQVVGSRAVTSPPSADAAHMTDATVASRDATPETAASKCATSGGDAQALQLLQLNRRLEAQLQVGAF
jgi:hypothetical protein